MSRPLKITFPSVGSIRRRIERPRADFPQPDSPTSPSVSPRRMSKETSETARTAATSRFKIPPLMGKRFHRFFTERRISPVLGLVLRGLGMELNPLFVNPLLHHHRA